MDDFSLERPELTGSLISMEFNSAGRIPQLWVADPNQPDGEEFQFVAPAIPMGDEFTEDYFPGTVMIGARTDPDEPWIVSRNSSARLLSEDEIVFEYDLPLLDEIRARGRFFEIPGVLPQICWELSIRNASRRSIEIGELAFPFALNCVFEGFPRTDKGLSDLYNDRVYVHKFVGGAASHLFAQRLTGRSPGLVMYPGDDTNWEFYNHIPGSLNTPYRWEGIPIVYIHSRAAIEREGWGEWFLGHSSLVLEPGEERVYQTRFAPAERDVRDGLAATLAACRKPAIKLYPGAVAPAEVGIAVEIAGVTPSRFWTEPELDTDLETDADEEGGFCFVNPAASGGVRLHFEDTGGGTSEVQLLFTEPIADLIQARAQWIMEHQIAPDASILPADNTTTQTLSPFASEFAIESGLADGLFLAEKNALYPDPRQIAAVDEFLHRFVEQKLRNPGDGAVGTLLLSSFGVATNYGRPQIHALTVALYRSMARLAHSYGGTRESAPQYLEKATETAVRALRDGTFPAPGGIGVPMMSAIYELDDEVDDPTLRALLNTRSREVGRRRVSTAGETLWHLGGLEEAWASACRRGDGEARARILRLAYAARSLSPSWWWYGSDKSWSEMPYGSNVTGIEDKGELCMGPTTVPHSLMMLDTLDRDQTRVSDTYLRMAFGGLLGIWSLVRADGAGSMGFCPDAASQQFGMSWVTGNLGISLYHYLRHIAAFVLPQPGEGLTTFGCHLETRTDDGEETYVVKPWDGVGRKIVMRHVGFTCAVDAGQIVELQLSAGKRRAKVLLQNRGDKEQISQISVRGLWGRRLEAAGSEVSVQSGEFRFPVKLPANGRLWVEMRISE